MTVVAIDGPAGSGKSTIAGALARRLDVAHVDTGAYYRAAAFVVLQAGLGGDDPEAMLAALDDVHIERRDNRTFVDGRDVEDEIRGAAVTTFVSSVSRHPQIRSYLVGLQQAAVGSDGAVVEGRDAGTVVVPGAAVKIWLTASPQERARRRAQQLGQADPQAIAAHAAAIEQRDRSDAAQMVRADDAVVVDTTGRSVDEILDDLVARISAAVNS